MINTWTTHPGRRSTTHWPPSCPCRGWSRPRSRDWTPPHCWGRPQPPSPPLRTVGPCTNQNSAFRSRDLRAPIRGQSAPADPSAEQSSLGEARPSLDFLLWGRGARKKGKSNFMQLIFTANFAWKYLLLMGQLSRRACVGGGFSFSVSLNIMINDRSGFIVSVHL